MLLEDRPWGYHSEMFLVLRVLIRGLLSGLGSRSSLIAENTALRHQLAVLHRGQRAILILGIERYGPSGSADGVVGATR